MKPTDIPKNPALALFPDSEYQTTHRSLEPGDTLLLFTDGIYEASDGKGAQFGRKRLAKIFSTSAEEPVEELLHNILSDVHDFSAEDVLEDDVCLVSLRWLGPDADTR